MESKIMLFIRHRRWLVVSALILVVAVLTNIGWVLGYSAVSTKLDKATTRVEELTTLYKQLATEYATFRAGLEKTSKPPELVSYSRRYLIDTADIAAAKVSLGRGEVFSGRLNIKYGTLVFYINDFSYRKVLDAGRIEGEYVFSFEVKESGDYTLVFDDTEGHRTVEFDYNSSSPLRDASVQP